MASFSQLKYKYTYNFVFASCLETLYNKSYDNSKAPPASRSIELMASFFQLKIKYKYNFAFASCLETLYKKSHDNSKAPSASGSIESHGKVPPVPARRLKNEQQVTRCSVMKCKYKYKY